MTPEAVLEHYRALQRAYTGGTGLSTKQFNDALDEYLKTGTLKDGTNLYAEMNPQQQSIFQEIKKSLKRIKVDEE